MKIDSINGIRKDIIENRFVMVRGDPAVDKKSDNDTSRVELGHEKPADKRFVNDAIKRLKHAGDIFNRRLDFKIDEATKRIVVKVIDTETDKVIKEIPPEQLIRLAAKIQEMIGLLVDEER